MKITDVFKSVSAILAKPAAEIKYKSLTEESLLSQIEDAKWALTSVNAVWSTINEKQLTSLYEQMVAQLKIDRNLVKVIGRPTADFFIDLPKELKGKSRSLGVIGSIQYTSKIMMQLLNDLSDNVSKIIGEKNAITINDVQISHGLFLGVLEMSRVYGNFNAYFLACLSHVISAKDGQITIPKYMPIYIADHAKEYVDLINHLTNAHGRYSVINEITNIKSHGLDFQFTSSQNIQARLIFDVLGVENIFLSIFNLMIRPIALIGETYVDMRHAYYESITEKKKWLESHIALLKMELDEVNQNDPNYIKQKKMIAFYEDKISEMDKKLQSYAEK